MHKVDSAIIRLALTGIMAGILFPATLSAYTIIDSNKTIILEASDRTSDNTALIQGCLESTSILPATAGYNFTKIIIQPGPGNASWPVRPLFF